MLKNSAVQPHVVQMVAVAITALRTVKHHAAVTVAVVITALTSVANKRMIVLFVLGS